MPCLCRMNKFIIQGLLWLYIFSTGLFVVSLEPGFLDFDNLPDTNFSCVGKVIGGYYADLETNCQMFHVCTIGQLDEPMDIRFLCLNGTVFDQETRVCERIDEVDCSKSEKFYSLNLELYGNTAPPILEENAETEAPIVEKTVSSTTTTTTTTTTTPRPTTTTTTRTQYFTSSSRHVTPSPYHKGPSSHHFLEQPPGFSPEEININLNPSAPSNLRTKPFEFPQHNPYSDNSNKKTSSTPSSVFKNDDDNRSEEDDRGYSSSMTESAKNKYNQNLQHSQPTQNTFKYNFNYHDTRPRDYNPPRGSNYQYHHNYANFRPQVSSNNPFQNNPYRSSTQRNEYLPVTRKNFEVNHPSSTSRSFFLQPIKSPSHHYFTRTEKPQGDQLPVPVLPTLSPIVFSSPSPFSLSRHTETKRYTDEHELPPRIIISASASVSDASGRTLNYSLGTIGAAQILAQPPASYDEYKEEDVVLDPFYHDVPKVREDGKRTKRETSGNGVGPGQSDSNVEKTDSSESKRSKRVPQSIDPSEIIKSEEEAVEVLKFLFDWYKTHEKSTKPPINIPVSPELISTINEQFSQRPYVTDDYEDDSSQTLEKSEAQDDEDDPTDINLPVNPTKKNTFSDSLLQLATRGPSNNRNINNKKLLFGVKSDPLPSKIHIDQTATYNNNYHNTPNPPDQKLETPSNLRSTIRGKPYRGRHRFTFPYVTTSSPLTREKINYENQYEENKKKVQNPSQSDYEEFYEPQTRANNNHETGPRNGDFYPDQGNSGISDNFRNFNDPILDEKNRYITDTIPFTTSQKPLLRRFDESFVQHDEVVTKISKSKDLTTEVTTQDYPEPSGEDNRNNQHFIQKTQGFERTKQTSNYIEATTSKYIDYESDVELNIKTSERTTTEVQETSTESYGSINSYDYVDDNYEPSTYVQNPKTDDQLDKTYKDEVRGTIHEETNINIDLTETPEEQKYGSRQEETTTYQRIVPNLHQNEKYTTSSVYEDWDDKKMNKSGLIDENLNSFGDILSSLRNFQKNEQEVYNYQHNLTEIKEFRPEEHFTTQNGEMTTLNSTSESSLLTQAPEAEIETSINITEENNKEKDIFNGIEEEYTKSTGYNTQATENYQPHLYTSKLFNIETPDYLQEHKTTEYETTETQFPETSTMPTTTELKEATIDSSLNSTEPSTQETNSSTRDYEDHEHATENISIETAKKVFEEEHTTILQFSEENGEEEATQVSPTPRTRYRGRNRGLKRTFNDNRGRMENMPVSGETSGRRRNSRRRQQNKPFYHQEKLDGTQQPITTVPYISTTETVSTVDTTTTRNFVTENVINLEKFILNDAAEKSSYESLPTQSPYSTPKGFYVTKNHYQTENPEEFISSTIRNTESTPIVQTTEQYRTTETNGVSFAETFSTSSTTEPNGDTTTSSHEYTDSMNRDLEIAEKATRGTASSETNATTETYSSVTNMIEESTDSHLDLISNQTEKQPLDITTTEAVNSVATNDLSNTDFISTNAPTSFTYSTLNISEIETATNSIAAITSTKYIEYKEEIAEYSTAEPTTQITGNYPTTEQLSTENTQSEEENINYTISNTENTDTEEITTKIDEIVQVSSGESTTQNIIQISEEKGKHENDIGKEQKAESSSFRNGRKYKDRKYQHKPNKQKIGGSRFSSRHRFSSTNVTPGTSGSSRPSYRHRFGSTSKTTDTSTIGEIEKSGDNENVSQILEEEALTETALSKNVKPTLTSEKGKSLSTTPMLYKVELRKEKVNKQFVFNCFGKPLNHFYSDPRDCRLFHYCTNGYSKNQLLDMKFVCDLGTHFDDEKLVCTREIPKRCL